MTTANDRLVEFAAFLVEECGVAAHHLWFHPHGHLVVHDSVDGSGYDSLDVFAQGNGYTFKYNSGTGLSSLASFLRWYHRMNPAGSPLAADAVYERHLPFSHTMRLNPNRAARRAR